MSNKAIITETSEEIDLLGKGLHDLTVLKGRDRAKCKTINLHNNLLSNIVDMPVFLFLTTLNLSSNRFKFVPDLSFLPALTTLDLSGNMVESLVSLCFLPGLKSFKLAYNCIKSMHGLTKANVPCLEFLDVRENPLVISEHELQPISSLQYLTEISIGTTKISTIALLFTLCPALQFVDHKSQMVWKEIAVKQTRAANANASATATAMAAAAQAAAVPVPVVQIHMPHFDKVAANFRAQPTVAERPRQGAQQGRTVYDVAYAGDDYSNTAPDTNELLFGTAAVPTPPRPSPAQPMRNTASTCTQHRDAQTFMSPPRALQAAGQAGRGTPLRSPAPAQASPPQEVSVYDESVQVSAFDSADQQLHSQRALRLQCLLLYKHSALQQHHTAQLYSALVQLKLCAQHNAHRAAVDALNAAHAQAIVKLTHEHSRVVHDATDSHDRALTALKSERDHACAQVTTQEQALIHLRAELDAERSKSQELKLTNAQLQRTIESEHELHDRQVQDYQARLQAQESQEQRTQERREITYRELESALGESTATIERLRLELSYCKGQVAQSESRAQNLTHLLATTQAEKGEIFAQKLAAEQQCASLHSEHDSAVQEMSAEKEVLNNALQNAQSALVTLRAEHSHEVSTREKCEHRLRQLHGAFETLKGDLVGLKQENTHLKERDTKNVAALQSLTANARKLQEIIELRKFNCEQCGVYEKQLHSIHKERQEDLRVCEKAKGNLQHQAEEFAQLQHRHQALLAQSAERDELLHNLQIEYDALHSRQAMQDSAPQLTAQQLSLIHTLESTVTAHTESIRQLEATVRVKDSLVHDLQQENVSLKDRLADTSADFKACRRDYNDLEQRHERNKHIITELDGTCAALKDEVRHLQGEVSRRTDTEKKLKGLIDEFQQDNINTSMLSHHTHSTQNTQSTQHTVTKQLFPVPDGGIRSGGGVSGGDGAHSRNTLRSTREHSSASEHSNNTISNMSDNRGERGEYFPLCNNVRCIQEKDGLRHEAEVFRRELESQKSRHDQLYMIKNEECAKFAQALTQLEVNSLTLATNIQSEKDKFEGMIEKYKADKRKLQKQCQQLTEELRNKESEVTRAKSAAQQLQGAFANFQNLGLVNASSV